MQTLGASVNIPLRIFDRNQGEKQRTQIDIDRSQQASEAARAQVFSDVDSAYAQVESNIALLKPYKAKYSDQATRVRDTVTYCLRAWRRVADGFSQCAERLPARATGLCATDRLLSDRRRTTQSCRRTRGNSMIETHPSESTCRRSSACARRWQCCLPLSAAARARRKAAVRRRRQGDPGADMNLITIDKQRRDQVSARRPPTQVEAAAELNATGTVFPDVSREVPVISLANGRVVDIKTRLDDNVKKGQLLFNVQSPDITNAFDAYLKAVNDEQLANKAYLRADDLFKHGAISQAMLEQAEDAEKDAKADLDRCRRAVENAGRRQESSQQQSSMCMRPSPASSSRRM